LRGKGPDPPGPISPDAGTAALKETVRPETIEPGSSAAVLVWENLGAAPLGAAVRHAGGQLAASGRIPVQAVLAAIEADAGEGA
jgi:hypothetical protein